ncbi:MAG: S9 family peptidase [Bacteroidales bacterium 36-12]|nr:MAG: S9 family peptidase [Bacteroidales bacterium 36-12]
MSTKDFLIILFVFIGMNQLISQENLSYQLPPESILKLADYERAPNISIDKRSENMLFFYRSTYKSLEDLNQDEVSLAGLRVNPVTHISSSITYINNIKVRKVKGDELIQIAGLPDNPRITYVNWSPDETKIAFTNTTQDGVELWVADIEKAVATRLTDANLNCCLGNPANWFRDSKSLLVRMLPVNSAALVDPKKAIPDGPIISISDGEKAQNRTYQDLLKNPTDEANFISLATSELYQLQLDGSKTLYKEADVYSSESFSPDGSLLLINTVRKPFSYIVPYNRFPQSYDVYDLSGKLVKNIYEAPLNEVIPKGFDAVRKGMRQIRWRLDAPSTILFVEALDEGDPAVDTDNRDALYTWKAPFDKEPELLAKTKFRFNNIIWGDESIAVITERWYSSRTARTSLINPSKTSEEGRIFSERNYQDIYNDPGSFATNKNQYGKYVLSRDNNKLFLISDGFTSEGQFPFVDELDIKTLKTKRIYQATETDKLEDIYSFSDVKNRELIVNIQSKTDYPNYYYRNLRRRIAPIQITHFENPFESISKVHKEVIKYKREDGVELSGVLYLPEGYDRVAKTEKLPLLIWAYPAEYNDKNNAGQITSDKNEFTYPYYGSFVYWVTRGYAVLDDASFPIVGEDKDEPNDTFVEQLAANAKAAIDAVDSLGYINRKKVAVGGHSYGAFMVANLLTHTDLFVCGIARSGAYNRTMTPFGFQREQRNYWEASEVYNAMSPFMHADKMKTPILLVHGEADNNPGTFTLQTERYFQALKGLGAPARMVILPKEMHSYVARENIMHLLWEQDVFLEKYMK